MDVWYILKSMFEFAALYCLHKCVLTMIAGMFVLLPVLILRRWNQERRADINFYAMLFLIPAAFTGMSKLFFVPGIATIPALVNYFLSKPAYGFLYFGVMAVLFTRFLRKNARMNRNVRALPVWEDRAELEKAIALIAGDGLFDWQRRYLSRARIYVTGDQVSPFSGGLLRPFVVMPRRMLEDWPEEERRTVLCHELVHLKSGHILWITLFQLLEIYWWINPAVYLCERLLREDMELVCDRQCVLYANVSRGAYGRVLVYIAAFMQGLDAEIKAELNAGMNAGMNAEVKAGMKAEVKAGLNAGMKAEVKAGIKTGMGGMLCFSGRNDFQAIKKRIGSLADSDRARASRKKDRRNGIVFGVLFAAMVTGIAATSYPKYTSLDEISLYDEELNMLDYDSAELRSAVQVVDGRLVIEPERFGKLLEQKDVKGDYVYVSYGGIMKVPGSGGCGNAGMVAVTDYSDIFYMAADGPEGAIQRFWLKYLI